MHGVDEERRRPRETEPDHAAVTEAEILAGTERPQPLPEREFADPVDEASADSFPASDPPAWTLGTD